MKISNLTKNRIKEMLSEGKRLDNRGLLDLRDLEIEQNVVEKADGSARVKLGDTEVIVGVKVDVSTPYPDSEDEGTLITTVELLPLSSPEFEPGPPRINATEIARIVDRGVRESGFIDFKGLCIEKGEKVYQIFLDIYSINNCGNLLDASSIASVAALLCTKMPKYDEENERIDYGKFTDKGLPLTKKVPLNLTFHRIGDSILLDPNSEEEDTSEARLSVAFTNDKRMEINAMQKGNKGTFKIENLSEILDIAEKKFADIEKKFNKKLK